MTEFHYRDEKNHIIRIVQITLPTEEDREERERQIVEDLHAIFEKSLKAVCQLLIHQIRMDADGGAEVVWNI